MASCCFFGLPQEFATGIHNRLQISISTGGELGSRPSPPPPTSPRECTADANPPALGTARRHPKLDEVTLQKFRQQRYRSTHPSPPLWLSRARTTATLRPFTMSRVAWAACGKRRLIERLGLRGFASATASEQVCGMPRSRKDAPWFPTAALPARMFMQHPNGAIAAPLRPISSRLLDHAPPARRPCRRTSSSLAVVQGVMWPPSRRLSWD